MNSPNIDPVLFSLGPLQVRWYGLMYVFGFLIGSRLLVKLTKDHFFQIPKEKVESFLTYLLVGMFPGARVFYVFVYNWDYYSQHVDEFFAVWKGGLSFHGALVGMTAACYFFSRKQKIPFLQVTDSMALAACPGLMLGRIGNFINGELYGRITDVPWGMVFPSAGPFPRHPSQLYEALGEGLVLGTVLWILYKKKKFHHYGMISATFLAGYGIIRFILEFFREADEQVGYFFLGTTTMGQILCLIMILSAFLIIFFAHKKRLVIGSSRSKKLEAIKSC